MKHRFLVQSFFNQDHKYRWIATLVLNCDGVAVDKIVSEPFKTRKEAEDKVSSTLYAMLLNAELQSEARCDLH